MKKILHTKARVEYLAIAKDAEKLLKNGHSFRSAYRFFSESHKISMSYDTFRRYALGLFTCIEQRRKKYAVNCECNPLQQPKEAMPLVHGQAPPPSLDDNSARSRPLPMAKRKNAPARPSPRIVQAEKTEPFGQEKIGPDEMF